MLRRSLDTYKKKIDANHHILFSYNIAIPRLEFLVDENLLEFFDDASHLIDFIVLELNLKVNDNLFVGFNQSFYYYFDSLLYIVKSNYCGKEVGLLKVFAQFDPRKASYKTIETLAEKHNLQDYSLDGYLEFATMAKVYYELLDLRYI